MPTPSQQLLLVLEIQVDKLSLALVDATARLTIFSSKIVPIRPQSDVPDQPVPHLPNVVDRSSRSSRGATPAANATVARSTSGPVPVRAFFEALDTALNWLKDISTDGQGSPSTNVIAISITSALNLRVLTSSSASTTLRDLRADQTIQSQLDLPSFLAHPLLLDDLVNPATQDLHHLENQMATDAGMQILDTGGQILRRDPCVPHNKLISRERFRKTIARRLGGPVKLDGLPVQIATALSSPRRDVTPSDWRKRDVLQALSETGRIMELGTMIACIFTGVMLNPSAIEASHSGFFNTETQDWDDSLLAALTSGLSSNQPVLEFSTLKSALGGVGKSDLVSPLAHVSPWLAKACKLKTSCVVMSAMPLQLAEYFSFLPDENDIGLQFGTDDYLVVPTSTQVTIANAYTMPNPLSGLRPITDGIELNGTGPLSSVTQNHLVLVKTRLAGQARKSIRNIYTNRSWDAFQRLMSAVCAGGSVGMDNKFYTICHRDGEHQSVNRYEMGVPVQEFSDLRANARCLIEGQALSMRSCVVNILAQDRHNLLTSDKESDEDARTVASPATFACDYHGGGAALCFDHSDRALTPSRILATGKAAQNRSIAECYCTTLGGIWTTQKECPGESEKAKSSQTETVKTFAATLGAAYFTFAALQARGAKESGGNFLGFTTCIVDKLRGRSSSHSKAGTVEANAASHAHVTTSTGLVVDASGKKSIKVPTGGRARSSSSPITTFMASSLSSSRKSTVSPASSSSSLFAIDTNSLILSPPSSSFLSSPSSAMSGANKSTSATGRSRTLSNLPAPLSQTFLDVLVEREEELTPRPYSQSTSPGSSNSLIAESQDHGHVAERLSPISERPKSLLERMSSAPNFGASLTMTNIFQPVGIATTSVASASGRSRASSSASSWGDEGSQFPQSQGADVLKSSSSLSRGVQWSDSTGTGTGNDWGAGAGSGPSLTRSGSFSSSFSPEAKPFVSASTTSSTSGGAGSPVSSSSLMSRYRSRSIGNSFLGSTTNSMSNRWPWASSTPAATSICSGGMIRPSSSGLSIPSEYLSSEYRPDTIHPLPSQSSEAVGASKTCAGTQCRDTAVGVQSTPPVMTAAKEIRGTNTRAATAPTKTLRHSSSGESHIDSSREKAMRAWLLGHSSEPSLPENPLERNRLGGDGDGTGDEDVRTGDSLGFSSLHYTSAQASHEQQCRQSFAFCSGSRASEGLSRRCADRERWSEYSKRQSEELLGLQRGPVADMDVWAVYGALLEEYVRLEGTLARM